MTTPPYEPPPSPPPTAPPPVPAVTPPPQKSGCLKWSLIGCSILFVLVLAVCAVVLIFAFGALKRTDVYKGALRRAQDDPRVVAALGSPVEGGLWVKGNIHFDANSGGNAELTFPIHGPKGKAMEHAVATYENRQWTYETLTVQPEGGPKIDLNTPP